MAHFSSFCCWSQDPGPPEGGEELTSRLPVVESTESLDYSQQSEDAGPPSSFGESGSLHSVLLTLPKRSATAPEATLQAIVADLGDGQHDPETAHTRKRACVVEEEDEEQDDLPRKRHHGGGEDLTDCA